jgi:TPR repeat protein
MMRRCAKLLPITLAAALTLVVTVGAAVAGQLEDGKAAYSRRDYAIAYQLLRPLADADAQHAIGTMYHDGAGLPQNYAEAIKWYRKAADLGFAEAQFNLGIVYEFGTLQNDAEAIKWYRKAAEHMSFRSR